MRKRQQPVFRHVCSNISEYNGGRDFRPLREETRRPPSPTRTQESTHSTRSSRRVRSETYKDEKNSEDTRHSRAPKLPRIEDIDDLVQERLNQASQQFPKGMEYNGLRPSDSSLSREITTLCFPKKFVILSFDHYLGTFDPLLHLCQYRDKMAVYADDDLLLYQAFPSSLKAVPYH